MTIPLPKPSTTDAEILLAYQTALSQTGSIKGTAKLLKVDPAVVRSYIEDHPQLKAYLPNAAAPTEAELLAAPAPLVVSRSNPGGDSDVALAMEKADQQLRQGLLSVGLDSNEVNTAAAMVKFGSLQVESMLHLSNGGMASLYVKLLTEWSALTTRINDGKDSEGNLMSIEEEQLLRNDRSAITKHLIEIANYNREAAVDSAKIAQMKKEAGGAGKGKKGKPGFSALEVTTSGPARFRAATQ